MAATVEEMIADAKVGLHPKATMSRFVKVPKKSLALKVGDVVSAWVGAGDDHRQVMDVIAVEPKLLPDVCWYVRLERNGYAMLYYCERWVPKRSFDEVMALVRMTAEQRKVEEARLVAKLMQEPDEREDGPVFQSAFQHGTGGGRRIIEKGIS